MIKKFPIIPIEISIITKEGTHMLIDFHTHTFPDKIAPAAIKELSERSHSQPFSDGTVQGLRQAMARDGVDISVVLPVATNPAQVEKINRRALEVNETSKETGLISFGAMHPDYADYKTELTWLKENGFKGIKLHPDYQSRLVDDPLMLNIISEAESLGLYTTLHAGIDIGYPNDVHCPTTRTKNMVDILHPTHVILAHTGGWMQWDEVIELLTDPSLFLDISFSFGRITEKQFLTILKQHGSDHLLFATDSPWDTAEHTLAELKKLPLSQEQFDDICYRTASKLLWGRSFCHEE